MTARRQRLQQLEGAQLAAGPSPPLAKTDQPAQELAHHGRY
jgi:hypothetical protein